MIRFRSVCGYSNNLYLDDVNVYFQVGTMDYNSPEPFSIYPNPALSELHVSGLSVNSEIYLTDITGRSLISAKTRDVSTVIDVGWLPKGIYFLKTPLGSRKIVKI